MYSKVVQHVIRRIAGHIRSTRRLAVKYVESMINFDHSETSGSEFQILNPISTPWMYKYYHRLSSDMIITCWTHVLNENGSFEIMFQFHPIIFIWRKLTNCSVTFHHDRRVQGPWTQANWCKTTKIVAFDTIFDYRNAALQDKE